MARKPLTEEQLIDAAITLVGATQTGELELTHATVNDMMAHLDNDSIKMILWKFASEIGGAARRANPGIPWPMLSEALRNHWREEGERFHDTPPPPAGGEG